MAFDAQFFAELKANLTSPLDLTTAGAPIDIASQINFIQGSGAGAADRIWSDTRTIAASGTDTLDLAGTLTDPFGVTITMARLKGLIVRAATGNTNDVQVRRPASNGVPLLSTASALLPIPPGGFLAWFAPSAAGVVVTAGTGDLIDFVNSGAGTPVTYDVVIIGASS